MAGAAGVIYILYGGVYIFEQPFAANIDIFSLYPATYYIDSQSTIRIRVI